MFSILNRALSWAITSFGNEFCVKKRLRLIEALDNGFYVKFMQLEIGLYCLPASRFEDLSATSHHMPDFYSFCKMRKLESSVEKLSTV